jgi:hypothetical protein
MPKRQFYPNYITYTGKEEYQHCVCRGCNNAGTNHLWIIYINKKAWFCDACKEDLISLKLVHEEI